MRGTGDLEDEKMYRIMHPDNMQSQDTWIIAFCPDSDIPVFKVQKESEE